MGILRWTRLLCIVLVMFSGWATASTIYSSPMLNEANNLVDIVPKQAKNLATNYLTQRRLADKAEKTPSSISRDETDSRIRTPGASIDALNILAKAEFNLGDQPAALQALTQAEELSRVYRLPYLSLEVQILKTQLLWQIDHNANDASARLQAVEKSYKNIKNPEHLARGINYKLQMLRAQIASEDGEIDAANQIYQSLKSYIDQSKSSSRIINYHIAVGEHWLRHKYYNRALSELLLSYWRAIEDNSSIQLAYVNRLLAQLFYERRVLDKALDHLSQAADFYDSYEDSPVLADVLKTMGDIYYQQGKYNLALVHYFNVMDHEKNNRNIAKLIEIRIALAGTYLQLYNYTLTEQYLNQAEKLLEYQNIPALKARALLLNAGLAYHQATEHQVVRDADKALKIALGIHNIDLEKNAYRMLYLGYEQIRQYDKALENLKHFMALNNVQQEKLNLISEDAFRQQKEFVEQTLHLVGQQEELEQVRTEYHKFQKIAFTLFVACTILFLFVLRRGYVMQRQKEEIDTLNEDLFTHSRSGLRNLRMLSANLPASLQASSHTFERWRIGELIHEPLNDRLKFVMIDVPFLRNMYLQHGYSEGLKLEQSFGEFLRSKIDDPARVYHFSDANLLYIEAASDEDQSPETLFNKVQQWVKEFKPDLNINRIVRVGMADYPFLPRAYTAINDKELLDILLMSTSAARTLSMKEHSSQWVYLKAIENAPAASLATGNIRKACKHSISQGLIKVHSSYQNEDSIKKLLKDE